MIPRPTAIAAERSLLGALILEPQRIGDMLPIVTADDFHRPQHAALFRLLVGLHRSGHPVDLVLLTDRIATEGRQDRYGGVSYVVELTDGVISTSNTRHYAATIRDAAIRRRLMDLAERLGEQAARGDLDVSSLLAQASESLARAHDGQQAAHGFDVILDEVVDGMQAVHEHRATAGISTAYDALDELIGGGLRPSELTILAARPAMGKSAVAMNIAANASFCGPVGVFSLEMARHQLVSRMLAMRADHITVGDVIDARRLDQAGWDDVMAAREAWRGTRITIDDTPGLTVEQLAGRARAMVAAGATLIVIDYLGKLRTEGRNPTAEVGRNVSALKNLARELKIPIICLAQLNRQVEMRADKRPTMADLRDSGEVEQEADSVWFVYRDHYYNPQTADPCALEIIVGKARMGRLGTVNLKWLGAKQLVEEPWAV